MSDRFSHRCCILTQEALSLLLLTVFLNGCGVTLGDPAQKVAYENRTSQTVTFVNLYDGNFLSSDEAGSIRLPPHSSKETYVMIQGKGLHVVAKDESGAILLDRRFLWSELGKAEVLSIVVQ